jgi:hypothetical protein
MILSVGVALPCTGGKVDFKDAHKQGRHYSKNLFPGLLKKIKINHSLCWQLRNKQICEPFFRGRK